MLKTQYIIKIQCLRIEFINTLTYTAIFILVHYYLRNPIITSILLCS